MHLVLNCCILSLRNKKTMPNILKIARNRLEVNYTRTCPPREVKTDETVTSNREVSHYLFTSMYRVLFTPGQSTWRRVGSCELTKFSLEVNCYYAKYMSTPEINLRLQFRFVGNHQISGAEEANSTVPLDLTFTQYVHLIIFCMKTICSSEEFCQLVRVISPPSALSRPQYSVLTCEHQRDTSLLEITVTLVFPYMNNRLPSGTIKFVQHQRSRSI